MSIRIYKLLTLFIILFTSPLYAASPWYVDCDAGGSGSGTFASPWNSIADVNANVSTTDDDVYFKNGSTCTVTERLVVDWSGTNAGSRVIIGCYDGDGDFDCTGKVKPIFDGNDAYPADTAGTSLVRVNGQDYVTIQDIEITNTAEGGTNAAARIAVLVDGGSDDVLLQRLKIHEIWGSAIYVSSGNNVQVEYNEIYDCVRHYETFKPQGYGWGGNIGFGGATNCSARYNYIHSTDGEGISPGTGPTIVEYNTIVDNPRPGIYINNVSGAIVRYNLVVGTNESTYEGGLSGWHGPGISVTVENGYSNSVTSATIHGNIVINRQEGVGISCYNTEELVDNVLVYNNTLVDNKWNFRIRDADRLGTGTAITVKNNIFYKESTDSNSTQYLGCSGDCSSQFSFDYNNWFPSDPGGVFTGGNDVVGDPDFARITWRDMSGFDALADFSTNDLQPGTNSVVIDQGADLGATYDDAFSSTTDYNTTPLSPTTGLVDQDSYTSWEMGAFVFEPAGALPTLSGAVLASGGTALTLSFDMSVTQGSGYNDADWDVDCTAGTPTADDIGIAYASGNGTDTHVYTVSQTVYSGATCNLDFNGDADSEENSTGGDLAAITSDAITNNSSQVLPPPNPDVATITGGGSETITVGGGSQTITLE